MGVTVTGQKIIEQNLQIAGLKIGENALAAASEIAQLLQNYERTHHLYQDRTSNLTNSTMAFVDEVRDDLITIILTAIMHYAIFLEGDPEFIGPTRLGTKYAWLKPAVEENRQAMIAIVRRHCGVG